MESKTVIKCFNQLFAIFGMPGFIHNDRAPDFLSDEVKQYLDRTYLAWVGGTTDDSVYYYRIHSPVLLIEFDHQRRVAPFRSREPSRDHIHAVVRTPNGNDYGKDLLRQHYLRDHNDASTAKPQAK